MIHSHDDAANRAAQAKSTGDREDYSPIRVGR